MLATRIMRGMETASADAACETALVRIADLGGTAGVIALDGEGRPGWAHNSPTFAVALQVEGDEPRAFHRKDLTSGGSS